jgi:hypothetical protein
LLERDDAAPLTTILDLPDGSYTVDLLAVAIRPMPALFGFTAWRKASFLRDQPVDRIAVGRSQATQGRLRIAIPPDTALGRRVFAVRATPDGVAPVTPAPVDDEEQLRRLRALGYVQ